MKKIIILVLIFLCFSFNTDDYKKEAINPPKWILGKWSNGCNSDFKEFMFYIFKENNIIFIDFSNPDDRRGMQERYPDYRILNIYDNNYYGVFFVKGEDTVKHEFKHYVFLNDSALLWNYQYDTVVKGRFSTASTAVLVRGEL